jgi:hypothetical protein
MANSRWVRVAPGSSNSGATPVPKTIRKVIKPVTKSGAPAPPRAICWPNSKPMRRRRLAKKPNVGAALKRL